MRRLVVGCGYLGERIARMWREAGDEVYATTPGNRADGLSRAGLRPVVLDVTQGPRLGDLPEVDTVVFAVGRARRSGATMFDIHVTGLRAVLDALPGSTGRVQGVVRPARPRSAFCWQPVWFGRRGSGSAADRLRAGVR